MTKHERKAAPAYVKQYLWEFTRGFCWYCEDPLNPWGNWTVDHVTPLDRGGTNTIQNLVPCCRACNTRKGTMLLSEWEPRFRLQQHENDKPTTFAFMRRSEWRENRLDAIESCKWAESPRVERRFISNQPVIGHPSTERKEWYIGATDPLNSTGYSCAVWARSEDEAITMAWDTYFGDFGLADVGIWTPDSLYVEWSGEDDYGDVA